MTKTPHHPQSGYEFASSWAIGAEGTSYRGSVDRASSGKIAGWCLNLLDPKSQPELLLVCRQFLLAKVAYNLPRTDIAEATNTNVISGYEFTIKNVAPAFAKSFLEQHEEELSHELDDIADLRIIIKDTKYELDRYGQGVFDITYVELLTILRGIAAPTDSNLIDVKRDLLAKYGTANSLVAAPRESKEVRCIAFYLPQFHPVPENDEWWGTGFTEWTNVTTSKPLFPNHNQPRLPADLGFYDLRLDETRVKQAELAQEYGINGFCYHYYWFSGRKILQTPIERLMATGKPDFPFCICWANESWSRRWDGSESEVLIHQEHNLDIDTGLIDELLPMFKDPRYIKIDGRPLFIIYRVSLLPNAKELFRRWRQACVAEGLPPVYICMAETFGLANPSEWGCDSSVEFPPHKVVSSEIRQSVAGLAGDFAGNIYDYREVVERDLLARQPDYTRFRTVMMGWDNTARRGKSGTVFHHANPQIYESWLKSVVDYTRVMRRDSEKLVFINAWNEWAEGTYLEPDRKNGHEYLRATRRALTDSVGWRELINASKMQSNLEGETLQSFLSEIENHFVSMERSISFVRDRMLSQDLLLGRTKATDVKPPLLQGAPVIDGGRAWIDQLGTQKNSTHLVHDKDMSLFVAGWAVFDGQTIEQHSAMYISLHSLDSHVIYYARIYNRKKREDLLNMLSGNQSEILWSGFAENIVVNDVPPGNYAIAINFPHRNAIYRHVSNFVVTIA